MPQIKIVNNSEVGISIPIENLEIGQIGKLAYPSQPNDLYACRVSAGSILKIWLETGNMEVSTTSSLKGLNWKVYPYPLSYKLLIGSGDQLNENKKVNIGIPKKEVPEIEI